MKLSIKHQLTAIALACVFSTQTLAKDIEQDARENEMIGLGSGVVLGTAIAGPLGGMVAGIIGLFIAEDINSDKKLAEAKSQLKQKDQTILAMQLEFEEAKQVAMIQIASLDNALEQSKPELESNIQFKSGSYVLQEHYKPQLDLIAQTLLKHPELTVSLAGYADQRGDDTFNQALSEQRALTVKQYLLDKNVKEKQVLTNYFGESSSVTADTNFENDFFDRRVHLKLSDSNDVMTAAN